MARWMDRWAARAQRKSDERAARWRERRQKRARSGQMTAADRFAGRVQRRSDQREARSRELTPLRLLVAAPIRGPGGSEAFISVDPSGARWMRLTNPGAGGAPAAATMLITVAIWWLVFRRSYTVHVRTNDRPPVKSHVRLPSEIAAYRAAAELVSRFRDEGPAALQGWQADDADRRDEQDGQHHPRYPSPEYSSRFDLLCQVIPLLTAGPLSGPDGIPVLICLSERGRRWSPPPKLPMPEPWLQAIAAERTLTGQAARIQMTMCSPEFVHAYAMSGPPHRIRRRFRYFGGSLGALAYVLALAEDVRSRGVKALS